jgi:hypothetical protein
LVVIHPAASAEPAALEALASPMKRHQHGKTRAWIARLGKPDQDFRGPKGAVLEMPGELLQDGGSIHVGASRPIGLRARRCWFQSLREILGEIRGAALAGACQGQAGAGPCPHPARKHAPRRARRAIETSRIFLAGGCFGSWTNATAKSIVWPVRIPHTIRHSFRLYRMPVEDWFPSRTDPHRM